MRIRNNPRIGSASKNGLQQTSSGKPAARGLMSLFSSELKNKKIEMESYDHDIHDLRGQIDEAGKILENEPTLPNFKKFRELLSRLAKKVSAEAYRLEKIGGTPMNPRYFEIITVIDSEADKLYQLVIKEQKDRMAITNSVIGIKGLVVDLIT